MKKKGKKKSKSIRSFRVVDVHSRSKEAFDDAGSVRVYIRLVDDRGRLVKGNIARSITVAGASVMKVFQVVRGALENART